MIARKVSVRDDTTFLQTLQLENLTANRFISLDSLNQKAKLELLKLFLS